MKDTGKPAINLEQTGSGFILRFKGETILVHEKNRACIEIGNGVDDFGTSKKHQGYFKPKDRNTRMHSLDSFEVIHESPVGATIQFGEESLRLHAKVVDGRLHLELEFPVARHGQEFNRFALKLPATKDEAIFGCGEQFTVLNLRGRRVPSWTQEPGLRERSFVAFVADLIMDAGGAWHTTYYPQPTFVSSRRYFVHVDTYAYTEMDFSREEFHRIYVWEVPGKIVIDVAENLTGVLDSLSSYLGRQRPLPDWAINGAWLGIGGGMEENDKGSVPWKVKKALEGGVKFSAIWVEDWTGIYRAGKYETRLFWNWRYDEKRYPKLPSYIQHLHENGIRFLAYNNCFLMKHGDMHAEAARRDLLVKNRHGEPYDVHMYSFDAGMLDLTNPETREWIKGVVKENMIDIGIDGWMCDFGEYLPVDAVLHSGEDPGKFHNEYPVAWARVNHEAVEEAGRLNAGEDTIVFFNRSGNHGTTKYSPLIWAGDQFVTFSRENGLASVINAAMSIGFCGVGQHTFDIGGLFDILWIKRSKELFMRSTEHAAFTTVMRTHDGKDYHARRNWTWFSDDETLEHFAKFTRIHAKLASYTHHVLEEYQQTGLPAIRHPIIHYENDQEMLKPTYQYQYLFGRDLLVAPVIEKGKNKWKVYVPSRPEESWVHLWTGDTFHGGWHVVNAPIGEPPVFFRSGSLFEPLFRELPDA